VGDAGARSSIRRLAAQTRALEALDTEGVQMSVVEPPAPPTATRPVSPAPPEEAAQAPRPARTIGETFQECHDLRRRYGDRVAVDGISFSIARGETYGLLGPNGAGKTTTISMVCGLLHRDGGTITVGGRPMDIGTTDTKALIGYVPQDLAIYPDLTARENLRFFGQLQRLRGRVLDRRVDEILEMIGLSDRANDRTDAYSGGMKRRLNIGIGLVNRPQLLVLDEPTVGVDPQSRNAILTSVADLESEGMAILYTTHYMEEAERLCDRIAIVDEGRIRAEGTRRELVGLVGERDRVTLSATGSLASAAAAVASVEGVLEVTAADGQLLLVVDDARADLPRILAAVSAAGTTVRGVEIVEPDLEAVFLHLTGKALRD
jgi:ABC-2 type transport system ATP-binding protein